MKIDVRVIDEDICKYCPEIEPERAKSYKTVFRGSITMEEETDIWKCKHYDICWGVHKRLQLQMDEEG